MINYSWEVFLFVSVLSHAHTPSFLLLLLLQLQGEAIKALLGDRRTLSTSVGQSDRRTGDPLFLLTASEQVSWDGRQLRALLGDFLSNFLFVSGSDCFWFGGMRFRLLLWKFSLQKFSWGANLNKFLFWRLVLFLFMAGGGTKFQRFDFGWTEGHRADRQTWEAQSPRTDGHPPCAHRKL